MSETAAANTRRKISTRLVRKGALIDETYAVFQHWEAGASVKANLRRVEQTNPVGARNARWLHEIVTTLSSRFSGAAEIESLIILAKGGFPVDKWRPCLLWHIGIIDEIYYRFATEWLFQEYQSGTYLIRTEDVVPFVRKTTDGRVASGGGLSEYGAVRAARDLLRMASDFGLLKGSPAREFASYHLPDESFLYLLYALRENEPNATRLVHAPDWRMFLMVPDDVERELFRLHQYRRLQYEVAGSLLQLKLPLGSASEYARKLVG